MSLEKILVSILTSFIQTFGIVILIYNLIPPKYKKNKLKFFIIMFLYGVLTFFIIPNQFRFIIFVTIIAILMKLMLNLENYILKRDLDMQ